MYSALSYDTFKVSYEYKIGPVRINFKSTFFTKKPYPDSQLPTQLNRIDRIDSSNRTLLCFRNMSLDSLNSHEKLNRWPKSFYLRGSQNGVKVSFNHHCISKITLFSQNLYSSFNNM